MEEEENEIQYFAGGVYSTEQIQDFLNQNKWINRWTRSDKSNIAKKTYTILSRVKIGDLIALKIKDFEKIKILAVGIVESISNLEQENGELTINWISKNEFIIDLPRGDGVGSWGDSFLEITKPETRYQIFHTIIRNEYLDSINIGSYFSINNISLKNLKDFNEVFILGENGNGKTLLLQAILISFLYNFIQYDEKSKKEITGSVVDSINEGKFSCKAIDSHNNEYSQGIDYKFLKDIYAYGVNRGNINFPKIEEYGFMTLFDREVSLRNPVEWLKSLLLKELYNEKNKTEYFGIPTQEATQLLIQLFDGVDNLDIKINPDNVIFTENGKIINFDQLSEGYKSVMIWVCDLLSRLSENQPDIKPKKSHDGKTSFNYKAIVLVDEIDLHLHPKWAYSIVKKLRTWFPNIQFFFTTHSPIVILGASDDSVIYKVYKEEGVTKISEPYYTKDFSNAMANIIITSPLFDLETAAMKTNSKDLDTNDSSLHSKIYKKVSEYMDEKRKQGKKLFTENEIDQIINEALILSKGESV